MVKIQLKCETHWPCIFGFSGNGIAFSIYRCCFCEHIVCTYSGNQDQLMWFSWPIMYASDSRKGLFLCCQRSVAYGLIIRLKMLYITTSMVTQQFYELVYLLLVCCRCSWSCCSHFVLEIKFWFMSYKNYICNILCSDCGGGLIYTLFKRVVESLGSSFLRRYF